MSQRVSHRPARGRLPDLELHPLEIAAPPQPSESDNGLAGLMQMLLPIVGGAGSLVMILANRSPIMLVAGGIMLAVTVIGGIVTFIAQRCGANRRATHQLTRYLAYLDNLRNELETHAQAQRQLASIRHPPPGQLSGIIRDPVRLWERRRSDPDFLIVRIGTGLDRIARPLTVSATLNPLNPAEPLGQAALDRLTEHATGIADMPVAVPLHGVVSVIGDAAETRRVLRVMLTQLAAFHAPDDVRIGLCAGQRAGSEFDWLKWLPHLLAADGFDGPVARRLVARSQDELADLLRVDLPRRVAQVMQQSRSGTFGRSVPGPRLVIVADQFTAPEVTPLNLLPEGLAPADLGLVVVCLVSHRANEPSHVDVRVRLDGDSVLVEDLRPAPTQLADEVLVAARRIAAGANAGRLDHLEPESAQALARQQAPLRLVADATVEAPLEETIELSSLVGVPTVATYEPRELWGPRELPEFLRVPFGLGSGGQRVVLDLKESAQNGMGPHGLCVGATGSGKSEVLRTLVLTLAMTHPPDRLNLVLVDYKGGATFAGLGDVPHTAAMVSNLSDDTGLVDRLNDAIRGELNRRQRLLLDAGSLPNTTEYNLRRDAGQDLAPLPNLMVVIDEFGELLTAKPDFIELFLQIGRIGRSIGVHLLLASQRLEEGRLRGLESYLSYRLGLRTFNEQESRAVLGVGDAYELPPIAGSGYLKVDTTIFERFKAAYVGGIYQPPNDEAPQELLPRPMPYPLFNDTQTWLDHSARRSTTASTESRDVLAPTTLDIVVGRLRAAAAQVPQIWLSPLPNGLALDAVLGELVTDPVEGLVVADPARRGRLRVPVGRLDKPAEQWQGPLELDLAGGEGHVAIMGAPRAGKSTAVRALICGAALTHTPTDVAFYCLDFGGGLAALADLPHVGSIASRLDPDRVRRTVAEFSTLVAEREHLFSQYRFDSLDAMRAAHRAGRLPELAVADIFLVVDNWTVLKEDFEDLTDTVQEIGTRGLGYGIHLIITTGRWTDLRLRLQAIIGSKLELRLNDPLDASTDRKAVANIRADTPGRAVTVEGLTAQLCLPRIDGDDDAASIRAGTEHLVKAVNQAWPGDPAPTIRILPTSISHHQLRRQHPDAAPVLIGIDEANLAPVRLDLLGADQHLLVFGDSGSGKTTLAQVLIQEITTHYGDDQFVFAVFDLRRHLLDLVPDDYLGAYAGTPPVAVGLAAGIASELKSRLPPDGVTTSQLRDRSWWTGPEIIIVADDYDLLSPTGPGPLAPLLPYLPQARDLGLHLVILRRSGGASRAIHEPVPQRLRELGATGLILSGDPQEGAIWPKTRFTSQPPGRGHLVRQGQAPAAIQLSYLAS